MSQPLPLDTIWARCVGTWPIVYFGWGSALFGRLDCNSSSSSGGSPVVWRSVQFIANRRAIRTCERKSCALSHLPVEIEWVFGALVVLIATFIYFFSCVVWLKKYLFSKPVSEFQISFLFSVWFKEKRFSKFPPVRRVASRKVRVPSLFLFLKRQPAKLRQAAFPKNTKKKNTLYINKNKINTNT